MQIGFCEALFVKMKSERWDVFDEEREIEQLRRFNFRPETFWERTWTIPLPGLFPMRFESQCWAAQSQP